MHTIDRTYVMSQLPTYVCQQHNNAFRAVTAIYNMRVHLSQGGSRPSSEASGRLSKLQILY